MTDLDYGDAVHAKLAEVVARAANRTPEERATKDRILAVAQAGARKLCYELARRQVKTDIATEGDRYRGSAA